MKAILHKEVQNREVQMIGPADAYVSKVNDVYRKVIYLKGKGIKKLLEIKENLESFCQKEAGLGLLNIQFDMNPMNGY